ncbi:site-specific integrase [Psychroflexus sp. CAK1W]|uniref:tyrosine-type recombinase/integrase n=1 Tax=Psychroflexus curvus TaxID=2873595 RepID=UPI001CCC8F86|nr:tyrosine-type recombinase/integrase [Psychroflexus curvus]MBZ9627162.1 site-specific integrase [Psychroflexus curvus]
MASGKFIIKDSKKEFSTIYYRFKQGAKFDCSLSTKIQVPKDRWSKTKEEILKTKKVDYKLLNEKLRNLDTHVKKEFENAKLEAAIVDSKWLKRKLAFILNHEDNEYQENEKLYLTNFIDKYIEDSKTRKTRDGKSIKEKTRQHYRSTKNKIIDFEKYKGQRVLLKKIDLSFHSDFIIFLETEHMLGNKTIGGYIDDIKLFCRNAKRQDISVHKDVESRDFFSPDNDTVDTYLNDDEINKIYNQNLKHDHLKNARDWFIIGLRTGLRVSDLLKLKKKNIDDGFINWKTKKTDFPVIIPIHPQVEEILKSRDGDFPREISDQKFNDYIKKVSKKAGIDEIIEGAKRVMVEKKNDKGEVVDILSRKRKDKYPKYELISSHICRRSFATNLYGKIDSLTIMKITGHKTETEFLKYIKITPREYAEKLKQFWNRTTIK